MSHPLYIQGGAFCNKTTTLTALYPQVYEVLVKLTRYNPVMDLSQFKNKQFTITNRQSEEYGDWVKKTCILLWGSEINKKGEVVCKKGKFLSTAKTLEAEKWTLDEIRTAYHNATKHHGKVTPQIAWWAGRKRRNGNPQP